MNAVISCFYLIHQKQKFSESSKAVYYGAACRPPMFNLLSVKCANVRLVIDISICHTRTRNNCNVIICSPIMHDVAFSF